MSILNEIEALTLPLAVPGQRITRAHTDRGTEFFGETLQEELLRRNVHHTYTIGYDPKANGTAERFVGVITDMGRKLTLGAKLEGKYWPYALEHATEHARSLVPLPKPKCTAFGSRVAVRKTTSSAGRRGFVPRSDIGRLLVHRQTSTKEAVILIEPPNEEPQALTGSAPVELSSVPWAVDYGQELPETTDKLWAPWERFETPNGEPFWVHLPSKEVKWTAPPLVDIEPPIGVVPSHNCPPEGFPPEEADIEPTVLMDPDPELMSQLLAEEENMTDDTFYCHRPIPIHQLTASDDSDPETTDFIRRREHLQEDLSDLSTAASETEARPSKEQRKKKYTTKRSRSEGSRS